MPHWEDERGGKTNGEEDEGEDEGTFYFKIKSNVPLRLPLGVVSPFVYSIGKGNPGSAPNHGFRVGRHGEMPRPRGTPNHTTG
jgi:hypothetical protein